MSSQNRSALQIYGGALVAVVAASVLRVVLNPPLGERAPFFTFAAAVVFACWWGGWRSGMVAALLSAVTVATVIFPGIDPVTFTTFGVVCLLVILLTESIRSETRRLAVSERTVRALQRSSARLNSTLDVDELLDVLAQEAIELVGAEGGMSGDAVLTATGFRPDAVVLDIGLPDMSGYEVAHRLRGQPETAESTLIALSGWGQDQDKRLASASGFDHHVTKPGHPDELVKLLEGLKRS